MGRLAAPFEVDLLYAPLQRLTRFRHHLAESLAREKNYWLSFLFVPFSAYSQQDPFSDLFGVTSLAVLDQFTTDELAQTPLTDLAAFVREHSRGRLADPAQTATTLQQAARDSYRLARPLHDPARTILAMGTSTIRALTQQLKELDRTIAQQLQAVPVDQRTLETIPGLGPVLTAGLLAEIGSIHRFPNDAALAKYAGLVWPAHESGAFQAEDTRLPKTGNAYLRYYLVEAANRVRLHCAEYRTYYEAKHAQSPLHAHKRALVLTARKLVRLVDSLLRTGSVYRVPQARPDQKEGSTPPNSARPQRQRRSGRLPEA